VVAATQQIKKRACCIINPRGPLLPCRTATIWPSSPAPGESSACPVRPRRETNSSLRGRHHRRPWRGAVGRPSGTVPRCHLPADPNRMLLRPPHVTTAGCCTPTLASPGPGCHSPCRGRARHARAVPGYRPRPTRACRPAGRQDTFVAETRCVLPPQLDSSISFARPSWIGRM
jgi:hypothetical protein